MKKPTGISVKSAFGRLLLRILLLTILVIMVYPLLWNIINSLKTNEEYLANPYALPQTLQWDNYVRALEGSNLFGTVLNSVYVVIVSTALRMVCAVPCAYALSRYRFFGSRLLMGLLMAGLFVSANYIIVPLFLELNALHLLNNLTVLSAIYATFGLPFSVFLLSSFMREIPMEYEEAAYLDGSSTFGILRHVVIPMSRSTILTVAMISVLAAWSEYAVALVVVMDPAKQTFPVGLANLYAVQSYATDWGALFAGLTVAMIPTLVLFTIGEKYAVKGMSIGGLKG